MIRYYSFQSARFIASFFEQAQISFRLLHFPWMMKSLTRRYLLRNIKSSQKTFFFKTSSAGFCRLMSFKNARENENLFEVSPSCVLHPKWIDKTVNLSTCRRKSAVSSHQPRQNQINRPFQNQPRSQGREKNTKYRRHC